MKTHDLKNSVVGHVLARQVRRLRALHGLLGLLESGDGMIGATPRSLAARKRLRADINSTEAGIAALPNGALHLRRALEPCPECAGRGHGISFDLEPPKCRKCRGTGSRFSVDQLLDTGVSE